MSDKKTIKCGVAGVGYLGKQHARVYHELAGVKLVGVYDIDGARAKEACDLYKCRQFGSLKEMGSACDAVSVVVPTDKHCEVGLALLKTGAHVLIEKPLCVSIEEATAIIGLARESQRIVQVGHIEHYNPVMSFLEEAVNGPRFITVDRLAPFNTRGTEVGVVLDLMIHDIGIVLQLVKSRIRKMDAIGVNILSQQEDIANVRMTFENGCVVNLNASRVSQKKVREIRVFQPEVYLSLDFMNQKGHLLHQKEGNIEREEIPIKRGEPLMLELSDFVACLRQASVPKVGPVLGQSALEVALEITKQIENAELTREVALMPN